MLHTYQTCSASHEADEVVEISEFHRLLGRARLRFRIGGLGMGSRETLLVLLLLLLVLLLLLLLLLLHVSSARRECR